MAAVSAATFSITDTPVASWGSEEVARWGSELFNPDTSYDPKFSKHNPTPGTGRTGFTRVPPNSYPFYSEEEKYVPVMQPDGGQLSGQIAGRVWTYVAYIRHHIMRKSFCMRSEWQPMYNPSKEQAEVDRAKAYETGIPHGYMPPGKKYSDEDAIELWVVSELHTEEEYGITVDSVTKRHSGGPFKIHVSPKMRIEDLRLVIRDAGGIIPALQKLSYAGKHMEDSQRTLEHYGVKYWNKRFPHWAIKIRRL